MTDPTARTLELLALLQTHRHWKGSELAERLGVSERTVRRDVDRLRSLGYPVDAETGAIGGYRLAIGTHVPPLMFDDDEAIALAIGLRSAAVAAIAGIEDSSVALIAKLDLILPDRLKRRVDAFRTSVSMMTNAPGDIAVTADALAVLSQACRDDEEVRFDYARRDGEESRRLVQPHQLVSAGRRWYLVAWDVRRADWRTFRVDRMTDPRLAGVRFEPRELPGGDAAAFVREGMRAAVATVEATVEVHATPAEIGWLRGWLDADFAPTAGEDTTTMRIQADSERWLAAKVALVATYHRIRVLDAPDAVRDLLATAADTITAAITEPR